MCEMIDILLKADISNYLGESWRSWYVPESLGAPRRGPDAFFLTYLFELYETSTKDRVVRREGICFVFLALRSLPSISLQPSVRTSHPHLPSLCFSRRCSESRRAAPRRRVKEHRQNQRAMGFRYVRLSITHRDHMSTITKTSGRFVCGRLRICIAEYVMAFTSAPCGCLPIVNSSPYAVALILKFSTSNSMIFTFW